ncbi:hypothetical protein [Parvularcula maris]|uniref:TonB-dependent receptor plug domain-containing protein n=1 Tax=Parvularcula maris TaxID=2965077 RepID=A0A9X2RKV4_9PROT|nr:hypothetical protein [Parvularcula maris]MCQ8186168.1 hypothetical protein [Parvularcula maris]
MALRFRGRLLAGTAAALGMFCAAGASAQEADRQVYDRAFFDRFAPQDARDMIDQVPGFSVRERDEARGLGQGGTNILINGERVTSKDTDVLEILENTPVRAVARIEVADAATLGVTGLTGQVANVVIIRSELSGRFRYQPAFRDGSQPRLTRGSVSVAGKRGDVAYTLGFSNGASRSFEEGPEVVTFGSGATEDRFERIRVFVEAPSITTALTIPTGERGKLTLRGSARSISVEQEETSIGFGGGLRNSKLSQDAWNANVAAEYTYTKHSGQTVKLIASHKEDRSPLISDILGFSGEGDRNLVARFAQENDGRESIVRAEFSGRTKKGGTWELAGEAAYNQLQSDDVLVVNGGEPSLSDPIDAAELRVQGSITRGLKREDLAVQFSAGAEWSEIDAESGDLDRREDFFRPKGLLTAAYDASDKWTVRGRLERSVGQLDLLDFIGRADLQEERDQGQNIGLVPEQAWEGELEFQRKITANEKIIFRLEGALIEDLLERGQVDGRDAVANFDGARFGLAAVEGTLFTKRWGFDGGRFDFLGQRQTSRVEDPSDPDGERQISLRQEWTYRANFRHDIPNTPYAYGSTVTNAARRTVYRFNEISWAETPEPQLSVFFEHKDVFGLNLVVTAGNLLNRPDVRERTIFNTARNLGELNRIEARERTDNQVFSFALSGTF